MKTGRQDFRVSLQAAAQPKGRRLALRQPARAAVMLMLGALFMCAGAGVMRAQTTGAARRSDTQSFNDVQVSFPLNEKVELSLLGHLRWGDNLRDLIEERVGVSLNFDLHRRVSVSPGYFYIASQPTGGAHVREHRFWLSGTVRFPLPHRFAVSDRSMFERRLRQPEDSTRYRNRLQLERPVRLGRSDVRLYVATEVFYDWSVRAWRRNRFFAGASRALGRHLTGDFYYMRQSDGRGRPGDLHVIGTSWRVRPLAR